MQFAHSLESLPLGCFHPPSFNVSAPLWRAEFEYPGTIKDRLVGKGGRFLA